MQLIRDNELLDFARQYVSPLDVANVRSTEIDICFGHKIWVERARNRENRLHALHQATWHNHLEERAVLPHGISLPPKAFILAEVLENFTVPSHVQGLITLRAWAAKSGLGQPVLLTLQPGWEGVPVLELVNNLNSYDLLLKTGCILAQAQFFNLTR